MSTEKEKEIIIVRGISQSIQAMAMPTFEQLSILVANFGYKLTKI